MNFVSSARQVEFQAPNEIFLKPSRPIDDEYARRCLRVLRMVAVLHAKGFHGLRAFMYEYPLAYRIELYPADFSDRDGVKLRLQDQLDQEGLIARHTGADGNHYFGWHDVGTASAEELALIFIQRFPRLAGATYHLDFAYVGWFATLLAHCQYGFLPYLFGEYEPEIGALRMRPVGTAQVAVAIERFPLAPAPSYSIQFHPRPRPRWLPETEKK